MLSGKVNGQSWVGSAGSLYFWNRYNSTLTHFTTPVVNFEFVMFIRYTLQLHVLYILIMAVYYYLNIIRRDEMMKILFI
jgi:hypothetical protein